MSTAPTTNIARIIAIVILQRSTAASHELLPRRVVEERCHKKDQRRSHGYYQQRRPAGLIGINAQVDEDQSDESADDCVPVISVARSLGGGSVAPDEFVQGPDLFFTRARAGDTVTHISRAGVAKSLVAVLADCNRVDALLVETLRSVYATSARAIRRLSLS